MHPDVILTYLNDAFKADPNAIHVLFANRVPCNMTLADHPLVQVAENRALMGVGDNFTVGSLGVINGMLTALGYDKIAMSFTTDTIPQFIGFVKYVEPQQSI